MTFIPFQMIPAFHWFALFEDSEAGGQRIPIICWALGNLTDDSGNLKQEIHGMISDNNGNIISSKIQNSFSGYEMSYEEEEYDVEMDILN